MSGPSQHIRSLLLAAGGLVVFVVAVSLTVSWTDPWRLIGLFVMTAATYAAIKGPSDPDLRIETLALRAEAIAAGNPNVTMDEGDDAPGLIARAVNQLAAQVHELRSSTTTADAGMRSVVDLSPRCTVLFDGEGRVVYANAAARSLLTDGAPLAGRAIQDLIAGTEPILPAGMGASGEKSVNIGQVKFRDAVGQVIMADASVAVVASADRPMHVLSFRDVHDDLHAAPLLAQRERFLDGIFQNAGVGIVVVDLDGTIRDANVTFREYVGRELDQLIGKPFAGVLHADEQQDAGRILAALGRGALNGFVTENRYVRVGGIQAWGETRSAALRDGNDEVERIIVAVTDLTARRRANATFRAVFEHSDDAYLILRRDRVEDANQAALRLFGVDSTDELSMPLLGGLHAPVVQPSGVASDELGADILDGAWEGTTFRGEWEVLRREGTVAPVGMTLVPIQMGEENALLVVAHDLTQRKQFEAALVEARDEAESAARAKADFLAVMSHEIRTPMNGVMGMVELLSQSSLNADQQRMINTTRDSASALLSIINDVLDFSKIEAGKLDLERVPVGLRDLVDAVTEMLGTNAADAGLFIEAVVDPDLPEGVMADPVRLRQILFNLVGNAIKFTTEGGVTLRATRREGQHGPELRLAIVDTGIGLTKEQADRLFQPFTQAESSTTRRFGGTGLGLSIVARLVSLMGGQISISSMPGEGSAFNVDLPLAPAEMTSKPLDLGGFRIVACLEDSTEAEAVLSILQRHDIIVDRVDAGQVQGRLRELTERPTLVYLGSGLDPVERLRIRGIAANDPLTTSVPFAAGVRSGSSMAAPDLPDTVMVATSPLLRSSFLEALGRAAGVFVSTEPTLTQETVAITRESAIARGQLLLVAEDNQTNREVIRRQLQLLGYFADIVDDGQVAIEAIEAPGAPSYAALLTDCHMPRVDGFALTKYIRDRERESDARLPILAITANAMQGEGERCLEQGMDGYLTKPLELELLGATLDQWVGPLDPDQRIDLTQPPEVVTDATPDPMGLAAHFQDLADFEVLDVMVLVKMLRGDWATSRLLLADFVPNARQLVVGALRAQADGDAEELARVGHTLKSSARAVGALRLGEACDQLESLSRQRPPSELLDAVTQLERIFVAVEQEVQEALDDPLKQETS